MENPKEKVFLENDGVLVTSARFVVDDQTYAMSGVTSVELETEKDPVRIWYFIIGCLVMFGGAPSVYYSILFIAIGLLVIAMGFVSLNKRKTHYSIIINAASGEEEVYSDEDYEDVKQIYSALNESIVYRG